MKFDIDKKGSRHEITRDKAGGLIVHQLTRADFTHVVMEKAVSLFDDEAHQKESFVLNWGAAYSRESSPQNLEGFLRAELDFGLTLADVAARDPQSDEHFGQRSAMLNQPFRTSIA